MARQTSIAAYTQIHNKGLLGKWQTQVYDVLYEHGPLTQNELHQNYFAHTQPRNVQPRVSELVAKEVVVCVGERPCSITGETCMVWDVTAKLPQKFEKKKTSSDNVKAVRKAVSDLLYDLTVPNDLTKDQIKERVKEIYDVVKLP